MPATARLFIRAYPRASTDDPNAERARVELEAFAAERNLDIACMHVENESGATLKADGSQARPRGVAGLADKLDGARACTR